MHTIFLNEPELDQIGYLRVALSEETFELRMQAIKNWKHLVVSARLDELFEQIGPLGVSNLRNAKFIQWVATSSAERSAAAFRFSETGQRNESKNEQELSVAEEIGFSILKSIQDGECSGVHTRGGIFDRVRDQALREKVRGAKDKDVHRRRWNNYRGVVHLGMALTYLEENPDQDFSILELTESFRKMLSETCPKKTNAPYVEPKEQISFLYLSSISGPRFGNRGLSYAVD